MSEKDGRFSMVVRVNIRKRFFKEKRKGKLVSDLLGVYYKVPAKSKEDPNKKEAVK